MKILNRKTGLVLSGGAVRGIAHLGVIQALNEKKISFDMISAASAGSLAGAFIADGFEPGEVLEIFVKYKMFHLIRISVPKTGFFKVDGLRKILESNLRSTRIEDLKIPLVISLTNFYKGKAEYFTKGKLTNALLASAGIPVLFETTLINKTPYIDGGVMDNLPIKPIKDKCSKIIAVNVNPLEKIDELKSIIQVGERAFHLAIASEIERKKEMADIFIEPKGLTKYGLLDLRNANKIFNIGYEEAQKVLESK